MTGKARAILTTVLVVFLAWGLMPLPRVDAGQLVRLSAQFRTFGDIEPDATTALPSGSPSTGGIIVYSKPFRIPAPPAGQQAVVFITMVGTAQHGVGAGVPPAGVLASCEIDGNFCNAANGNGGLFHPAGWVPLLSNFNASVQRNVVHYTWCAKVSPGPHIAEIRLASQDEGGVFLEASHYYLDRTTLPRNSTADCEVGMP